jgi:hypothetical protein
MRGIGILIVGFLGGCLNVIVPEYPSKDPNPTPPTQDPPAQDPQPQPPAGGEPDMANPPVTPQQIQIEGESATLLPQFVSADDALASGGKYLVAPAGSTAGKATFTFNVTVPGKYLVWGRVIAPADASNSFHASMDTDTVDNDATDNVSTIWDLPISATWTWVKLNTRLAAGNADALLDLTAGSHTFYLNFREAASQLDRLIVTNESTFTPTN